VSALQQRVVQLARNARALAYALLQTHVELRRQLPHPGLGFIHLDTPTRDSVACDLMEPVQPQVDAYVLDWITREPLKREWLFEQRDGTCRLMASLAIHLSETAPMWARAVAPFAEWTVRALWSRRKDSRQRGLATPLTQQRRREAKGTTQTPAIKVAVRPQSLCRTCGKSIETGRRFCAACAVPAATEHIKEAARAARTPAHSSEARAKQAETQRRHGGHKPTGHPPA